MRLFNNTRILDTDYLMEFVRPHWFALPSHDVESIEVCEIGHDLKITFFGIECVIAEVLHTKDTEVEGTISWFNESSGEGMIRLNNGKSVQFYSCNVVGADSMYPELVSNVQFSEGDPVKGTISGDAYMFSALGLINVTRK